jgi:hypothetical protein
MANDKAASTIARAYRIAMTESIYVAFLYYIVDYSILKVKPFQIASLRSVDQVII